MKFLWGIVVGLGMALVAVLWIDPHAVQRRYIYETEVWPTVRESEKVYEQVLAEVARLKDALDVLATLEEWQDQASGTDGTCHVRAEYIRRLFNDNVILAQCCTNGLVENLSVPHSSGLECDKHGCTMTAKPPQRFSSDDLLPAGAVEQGGIMPMLQFMRSNRPPIELPFGDLRPPTAAELRRIKGSVVVP